MKPNQTPLTKDTTQKYNHFPCECACHDPSYRYETIPCKSCASSTPSTKEQEVELLLAEFLRETLNKGKNQPLIRRALRKNTALQIIELISAQAIKQERN